MLTCRDSSKFGLFGRWVPLVLGQALFLFTCTCLSIAHWGWIQKFQKEVARTLTPLPIILVSFDFSENSIKMIQNFKEKGVAMAALSPPLNLPFLTVFKKPETD